MILECSIYKGSKTNEMYLYVPSDEDLKRVPAPLIQRMGRLELVMTLELHPDRELVRADVGRVMQDLRERGFYLQMPPSAEDR